MFRRPLKEKVWVLNHILVKGATRRHQDRQRPFLRASGAAHLLPNTRNGAGVATQHRRLQPADINAQFQRIGRHHPAHRPAAQPRLNRPPLSRQVAAPVAPYR